MMARLKLGVLWLLMGAIGLGLVTLNDLGRLLADIQVEGASSYSAWVFTGPKVLFTDSAELRDAILLWRELADTAKPLLRLHALLDLGLLILWYCVLLYLGLRHVGAEAGLALLMVTLLGIADLTETVLTLSLVAEKLSTNRIGLGFLQFFSLVKWVFFAATLTTMAVLWLKPEVGEVSVRNLSGAVREAREGRGQHPGIALLPLIALVALFCALIALPAGGPLEQIPDVLRYQLSAEADWWLRARSTLALVLLAAAVVAAGLMSTDPSSPKASTKVLGSLSVVAGAAALSGLLFVVAFNSDEAPRWSTLSFALVALVVAVAGWLADKARGTTSRELSESDQAESDPQASYSQESDSPTTEQPESAPDNRWVGALGGAVVVAGGLGLVRAAFPPVVLGADELTGLLTWWRALVFGGLTALFGGFAAQWVVELLAQGRSRRRLASVWILAAVAVVVAGWLSVYPTDAGAWGTTGVVAIGFGTLALIIGLLRLLSRAGPVWWAPYSLGFGRRTPWLILLAVVWGVASVMNTKGVYHDARVLTDPTPSGPRYRSLHSALQVWLDAQTGECAPTDSVPLPLVLVAAPGGGIRAAYWTAATLDRLFGPAAGACAARRLFAVSGVSGGSVGAATWVSAMPLDSLARDAVERMSRDHSLAAAAAGLLLRDPVQPLTGITSGRTDRAALLEDGWMKAAGVYGSAQAPVLWRDTTGKGPWVPVLVLNASSVNDGCRVLISNVGHLPAMPGKDCGATPVRSLPTGPVSGSIDPFPGLYPRSREEHATCADSSTDMRAVTAALLSARFPVVSPSGALLRCIVDSAPLARGRPPVRRQLVTYTVDGGYFENSGLMTLLQIWESIEPKVREHSNDSTRRGRIVPWILVADNHYREKADAPSGRRPLELLVLFKALASTTNRVVSQGTLEQQARATLGSGPECLAPMEGRAERGGSGCFVVIAPSREPAIAAPLGWVLSPTSRADLNRRMDSLLPADGPPADPVLAELLRQLLHRTAAPMNTTSSMPFRPSTVQ